MTLPEQSKARKYIKDNYPDKQEELTEELQRYINTNDARNSNKLTFASLSYEVRTSIAKTRGVSKGKLVI